MMIPAKEWACGVTSQKKRCWQSLQGVRASDARQRRLLGGHADHAQRQQFAPADASMRQQGYQQGWCDSQSVILAAVSHL